RVRPVPLAPLGLLAAVQDSQEPQVTLGEPVHKAPLACPACPAPLGQLTAAQVPRVRLEPLARQETPEPLDRLELERLEPQVRRASGVVRDPLARQALPDPLVEPESQERLDPQV
ncbi:unnamed protein product, partial [marine sediment metagenome]